MSKIKPKENRQSVRHMRYVQRTPGFANDYLAAEHSALMEPGLTEEEVTANREEQRVAFNASDGLGISTRPHIDQLLGGAMALAGAQLRDLIDKQRRNEPLSSEEKNFMLKLFDSIPKLTRAEREQRKFESHENLSEEELQELTLLALAKVKGDEEAK